MLGLGVHCMCETESLKFDCSLYFCCEYMSFCVFLFWAFFSARMSMCMMCMYVSECVICSCVFCPVLQFLHSKHMFTFFSPEGQWTLSVPTAVISPANEPVWQYTHKLENTDAHTYTHEWVWTKTTHTTYYRQRQTFQSDRLHV